MSPVSTKTNSSLRPMRDALQGVRRKIQAMGLTLTAWDRDNRPFGTREACNEFCRRIGGCDGQIPAGASDLAADVLASGKPSWRKSPTGCCLLGAPIFQRRRQLGAAVACFAPKEMADEEFLRRLCDRLALDYPSMEDAAAQVCRHDASEAEDLLRTLGWLLESEQASQVSQEEIASLSTHLTTAYEELSLLYRISGSMGVQQRPMEFLQNICNGLVGVMGVAGAAGMVCSRPGLENCDTLVQAGDLRLTGPQVQLLAEKCLSRGVAMTVRPMVCNRFPAAVPGIPPRTVRNMVAMPLVDDKPVGMLLAINKTNGDFDSVDLKLMSSIGSQAAVFLANYRLYADLQELLMGVLHALTSSIDAKDPYTSGHSHRVAILSRRLAERSGFDSARADRIYMAGLLHDVGKIGVPESVLCKPGRLTDDEYRIIKEHPAIGAKIIGGVRQLSDLAVGVLTHHERPDGRGYPQGLKGDQMPVEGRIIGLADCFDAMTTDRTYRAALPLEAVVEEIRKNAGTQFDARLAEKFLAMDLASVLVELREPQAHSLPENMFEEVRP